MFLALPHGASAEVAGQLGDDVLVIDAGADYRLTRRRASGRSSTAPPTPARGPTGCRNCPASASVLAGARRIAVPGCFPTTITLALLPALVAGLIDGHDVVVVAATRPVRGRQGR